jgi:hypothetical protein
MGHAILWPDPKMTTGRRNLSQKPERLSTGYRQNLVSQARVVRNFSQALANQVVAGKPLNEAYETVRAARIRGESDEAERGAKKGKSSLPNKELPFSAARLSQARSVLAYSRELADQVYRINLIAPACRLTRPRRACRLDRRQLKGRHADLDRPVEQDDRNPRHGAARRPHVSSLPAFQPADPDPHPFAGQEAFIARRRRAGELHIAADLGGSELRDLAFRTSARLIAGHDDADDARRAPKRLPTRLPTS